jgi:hypothetical protein
MGGCERIRRDSRRRLTDGANRGPSLTWWLRSTLSLLVAVGVLAVALPAAFGSGFKGGVDSIKVFSTSPMVSVDARGSARLSVAGMVPGQSQSATIRVTTASAPASLSISSRIVDRVGSGGTPLSRALVLTVESAGSSEAPLYSGPIGAMPELRMGSVGRGERSYRFTVTLPVGAGNAVEGSALSARFVWNAG